MDISVETVHNVNVKVWPPKVRWQKNGHFEKMELKGVTLL